MAMRILVTGGAGFIGSHFIRLLLKMKDAALVVNLDALRYAGNLDNVGEVASDPRYRFVQGDICDAATVRGLINEYRIDTITNFAAETHVDRSILEPGRFLTADVIGTGVLLEAARTAGIRRFLQVSTDEVYGDIKTGQSHESDAVDPRSPYAASKAAADLLVRSYFATYGMPAVITRGSNTFGPNQHPEKFIALFATNAMEDLSLPLYGDGLQQRDWLYVEDHCAGIVDVLHRGAPGEIYNIGAGSERRNIEVAEAILNILGKPSALIKQVTDRPGHDRRYALNCEKIRKLGWHPRVTFEDALKHTVLWYRDNPRWWKKIKSGEFRQFYDKLYSTRLNT